MNDLPKNFVPLFVVGETDGYLTVYTKLSNEEVFNLLNQTMDALEEDGFAEDVVTLQ